MDSADQAKGILQELPELLNKYSGYSAVVLILLLLGAAIVFGWHFADRRRGKKGLGRRWLALGGALAFLSAGGLVIKVSGQRAERRKREAALAAQKAREAAFVASHRAADGESRLMISDFTLPSGGDDAQRRTLADRMRRQVPIIIEILGEDLPAEFSRPQVVQLPLADSPWPDGIREDNIEAVLQQLRGFELLWGHVSADGRSAKTFLGLPREVAGDLDVVIPLKDVRFEDDPAAEYFREGRQRLLGQVMLGIVLDSCRRAAAASGPSRKELFLKAASQLQLARRTLANSRTDKVLQRNLFNSKVDDLIKTALAQEGLPL